MSHHGKLIANCDMDVSRGHLTSAQVRANRYRGWVEVTHSNTKGLRYMAADQTFVIHTDDLRGLIRVLRQAERAAVKHGLLPEVQV